MLCSKLGSTTLGNLKLIILGLGTQFLPVNALSKQKRAMRREINNLCGLKIRRYADPMIDLSKYLSEFLWEKEGDKIC